MKKIFAVLMTICLLAGALSITAFAAEAPAEGVVIRVSAKDKKTAEDVLRNLPSRTHHGYAKR